MKTIMKEKRGEKKKGKEKQLVSKVEHKIK